MKTSRIDRPFLFHQLFIAALGLVLSGFLPPSSLAQRPSSSRQSLAVDEVTLSTGKRMYGIVLKQVAKTSLSLMVDREWFKKTDPADYAAHCQWESESRKKALTTQRARLENWREVRAADDRLVAFIDQELDRQPPNVAKQPVDTEPPSKFTLVTYDGKKIRDVFIQPPEHHQIAGCAWKHGVERVTTRNITTLKRELDKLRVDVANDQFDLSADLPYSQAQSDIEWNARKAVIEYRFRKQLQFQGTGSTLVRIDPDKPAELQSLALQLIASPAAGGGQLDELLSELNLKGQPKPDNTWWKHAATSAESEDVSGFLTIRVGSESSNPVVKVEFSFFAQVEPNQWKQILAVSETVNRNEVDQVELVRIKNDPQVNKVLAMAKGLGLSTDQIIETAIRQGAATDIAMKEAEGKFVEFIGRYIERSDGPPLLFK